MWRFIETVSAFKHKNINNTEEFLKGCIAPDFAKNKDISHFSKDYNKADLMDSLLNKVNLKKAVESIDLATDYNRGIFLHLLTDYEFYTNFFNKTYLDICTFETFLKDLYYSYDITDTYIKNKYKIDYPAIEDVIKNNMKTFRKKHSYTSENNIIPQNKLDNFIENISNRSIESYYIQ